MDLVLYGARGLVGIEVKSSPRIRAEELRGLSAFGEDYPMARRIFVHGGDAGGPEYEDQGILFIPAGRFF